MQIGDILNGTYQVERPLGVGGQARVWQARHLRLPRRFAVKECPLVGGTPAEIAERRTLFERERDIVAALSHPGHPAIPKISDFWEEPTGLFIVLDLVEGETLIELLTRRGRVTAPEAIAWGRQICEVLTYLHNWVPPIIYRDLSPDNVILDRTGQLHLIDFGIARTFKPGQPQNTTALGKAGYASPEHLEGGKTQTDVRSDIYTLGALLFHLLTGQEPIPVVDRLKQRAGLQGGRSLVLPRTLNSHLSPAMEHCILTAMELEPNRRFQNARDMDRALAAASVPTSQGQPLPAPNEMSQQRLRTRPVDPSTAWGGASAPTATPPSLPPHPHPNQRSASPWPQDHPGEQGDIFPRAPITGPQPRSGLPPAISGSLGPAPIRRMPTGPTEPTPAPGISGPLPEQPARQTPQPYTGPMARVRAPGSTGLPSPTGPIGRVRVPGPTGPTGPISQASPPNAPTQNTPIPGHILSGLPASQRSQKLGSVSSSLPRMPVARRGPRLTRRQMLAGLGILGVAALGVGGAAFVLSRSRHTYAPLYTFDDDDLPVQCVGWSPNGRLLAGGGNNRLIKIWNMDSGKVSATLKGHTDFVQGLAWSSDGVAVASASADKTVLIWDALQGGMPTKTLSGHTDTVYSVAWSPNGNLLATASADQTVLIWDVEQSDQPKQVLKGHTDTVYSVAWSPDGTTVASASQDDTTKLWNPNAGGPPKRSFTNNSGFVRSVAWSSDSNRVASGSHDKIVTVWNADSSYPPAFTLQGPKDVVTSVSWSGDGGLIAAGSDDHTVTVWGAHQAGPAVITLTGHSASISSVAWSPDSTLLASSSVDNTIIIWQRQG
jgi:serine/threonine protein kinase